MLFFTKNRYHNWPNRPDLSILCSVTLKTYNWTYYKPQLHEYLQFYTHKWWFGAIFTPKMLFFTKNRYHKLSYRPNLSIFVLSDHESIWLEILQAIFPQIFKDLHRKTVILSDFGSHFEKSLWTNIRRHFRPKNLLDLYSAAKMATESTCLKSNFPKIVSFAHP